MSDRNRPSPERLALLNLLVSWVIECVPDGTHLLQDLWALAEERGETRSVWKLSDRELVEDVLVPEVAELYPSGCYAAGHTAGVPTSALIAAADARNALQPLMVDAPKETVDCVCAVVEAIDRLVTINALFWRMSGGPDAKENDPTQDPAEPQQD